MQSFAITLHVKINWFVSPHCSGQREGNLQLDDEDDVLLVLVDLVQVDDVVVLHLGQDVDLLLDVPHGDAAAAGLHPLLLDVLGGVLCPGALLYHSVHHSELATAHRYGEYVA